MTILQKIMDCQSFNIVGTKIESLGGWVPKILQEKGGNSEKGGCNFLMPLFQMHLHLHLHLHWHYIYL